MVDVARKLVLIEGCRQYRDELAGLAEVLVLAVDAPGSGRNQVAAIGKLRLQQRPRDGVDGGEVQRALNVLRPDRAGEVVNACVGAVVGESRRKPDRSTGLVDESRDRPRRLVGAEEERLVADDRSAQGEAAFVAAQFLAVQAGAVEEEFVRDPLLHQRGVRHHQPAGR